MTAALSHLAYMLALARKHPVRAARIAVLRSVGAKCGAYGGPGSFTQQASAQGVIKVPTERWCLKPYGHSDSCCYDQLPYQPGTRDRRAAKGY